MTNHDLRWLHSHVISHLCASRFRFTFGIHWILHRNHWCYHRGLFGPLLCRHFSSKFGPRHWAIFGRISPKIHARAVLGPEFIFLKLGDQRDGEILSLLIFLDPEFYAFIMIIRSRLYEMDIRLCDAFLASYPNFSEIFLINQANAD